MLNIQLAFLCGLLFVPVVSVLVYFTYNLTLRIFCGKEGVEKARDKQAQDKAEPWTRAKEEWGKEHKNPDD